MTSHQENLKIALWVAIGLLLAAILPIWPYGIYTLLRLVVTLVAIYGIFALGTGNPVQTVGLAVVALLFNPIVTVHLPRLMWAPIDLGVAYWFWTIIDRQLSPKSEDPKLPQQS